MRLDPRTTRGTLAALVALATVASLVGPASADRGGRRYKNVPWGGPRVVSAYPVSRVVYTRRSSDAGPALAGFIGGLVLGSVISHAQEAHAYAYAPPPCDNGPDYFYYDPYCRRSYASLDDYACHRWHHPGVVQVIEIRSDRCVGERAWDGERWRDRDDRRDDRYGDGGYDGGYDNQDGDGGR